MAAGALRARLGRLENRAFDVWLARMARREAGGGVTAAEIEAETRRFFRLVRTRLGSRYDPRDLAELIAEEYGLPVAEAFRQIKAARAAAKGRRGG